MTTPLTKLIAENKERPIAEAKEKEEYIITGEGCSAIAVRQHGKWITGFNEEYGTEYAEFEATHFRPLPDDRLARVTEVLLKALDDIEEYTQEVVTRFTCSQIRKQATAIAEGKE